MSSPAFTACGARHDIVAAHDKADTVMLRHCFPVSNHVSSAHRPFPAIAAAERARQDGQRLQQGTILDSSFWNGLQGRHTCLVPLFATLPSLPLQQQHKRGRRGRAANASGENSTEQGVVVDEEGTMQALLQQQV